MSDMLVSTDWLQRHLETPGLRIYDCTVHLHPWPGAAGQTPESGFEEWQAGHIPGSAFIDLTGEFAAPSDRFNFLVLGPERFAQAAGKAGIGEGTRVVLYDRALNRWAARMWWMLRAFGFDTAAVLDGGWNRWVGEGRPVSVDPPQYPSACFDARPRYGLIADKTQVAASLGNPGVHLVNALTAEQHEGAGGVHYGRPGHIPGSVNLSARDLVDSDTHAYLPLAELRQRFAAAGVLDGRPVIVYCGSGIAASSDALILTALGAHDVSIYTNSLQEWAADLSLPMTTEEQ